MAAVTDVINECELQAVSTSVPVAAFANCNSDFLLAESFGAPYAVATLKTVAQTVWWHSHYAANEPLMIRIEKGDNDQATFGRTLARLGKWDLELVTQPIIQRKKWTAPDGTTHHCLPFQAADFLCYETTKMFTDLIRDGKRTVRESIFRVSYPRRGDIEMSQFLGEAWLRKFARHFGVTQRFNRTEHRAGLPNEPLCYLDMDQPLVADINPESWSRQAPRAVVEALALVRRRA